MVRKGDFDSDGILDLAVTGSSRSDNLHILIGNDSDGLGNGTFHLYETFSFGRGSIGLCTDDLNRDGINDVTAASESFIRVMLTNAPDNSLDLFGTTIDITPDVYCGGLDIVTGDFDDNGLVDLAVLSYCEYVNIILARDAEE
jgi:hypothetical protein